MVRFSKYFWLYFIISAIVLVPGVYSLLRNGFRPAVDFTGGTLLEIRYTQSAPASEEINLISKNSAVEITSLQRVEGETIILRLKPTEEVKLAEFLKGLNATDKTKAQVMRQETVGPILGGELLMKAVVAAILAIFVILGYVVYAFKNLKYGVSAVLALIHDLLVVLGSFSLLGHFWGVEIDTLFVTAFLTTMSFSVHDTIVVFDRIREYRRKDTRASFDKIADEALTATFGRSLTNSMTIVFMLLALVLMGGESVKWFAVALLIGTISGTYSSPFVATPILILWDRWESKRR